MILVKGVGEKISEDTTQYHLDKKPIDYEIHKRIREIKRLKWMKSIRIRVANENIITVYEERNGN
jgi:hypothetical protein